MVTVLECLACGVRAALVCGAFVMAVIAFAPIVMLIAVIVGGLMDMISRGGKRDG